MTSAITTALGPQRASGSQATPADDSELFLRRTRGAIREAALWQVGKSDKQFKIAWGALKVMEEESKRLAPDARAQPAIQYVLKHLDNKLVQFDEMSLARAALANAETRRAGPSMPPAPTPARPSAEGGALASRSKGGQAKPSPIKAFAPKKLEGVSWDDVIGLPEEKQSFRAAVEDPIRWPQLFGTGDFGAWRGVLLYGPPGTGKTLLAKAAASECEAAFFEVKASDIMQEWVGMSERSVRELFTTARDQPRSIIFIDECDSLMARRRANENSASLRVKTELLTAMDGFSATDKVMVIGATNRPEELDEAFKRRFEKKIYVGAPSAEARRAMFATKLKDVMPGDAAYTEKDIAHWAALTSNCTGAEISIMLERAAARARSAIFAATAFREESDGYFRPCASDALGAVTPPQDPSELKVRLELSRDDVLFGIQESLKERITGKLT